MVNENGIEWGIFARELKRVFKDLGIPHTYLDDLKDDQGTIVDKRKAARIWASLDSPKHFAILNPTELSRLIAKLELKVEAQTRLQAAILATAVEITLMNRIPSDLALMASKQVFEMLHGALTRDPNLASSIKGGNRVLTGGIPNVQTVAMSQAFETAKRCMDDAVLILHACNNALNLADRTNFASDAIALYTRAIELLQKAQGSVTETDDWEYWYNQAQKELRNAQEYENGTSI